MSDKTATPAVPSSRRLSWWPLGAIAIILLFAIFGNRGILHIFKLKRHQAELQQQLGQIEEVNTGLRREIASLSSDRHHLERLARSQLGMVRDDEVIYQFATRPPQGTPAPR